MSALYRRLVSIPLLSLLIGPLLLVPQIAQARDDLEDPASATVYFSELESRNRFARLYDLMHPDARHIIPEEVVVGWYENDFAPLGPGVVTVENVDIGPWTWDVNGETYSDAAEITYTQPFADGSVVRDTIHLVEHDGEWLWFFGPSREFVDAQIDRFADDESSTQRSADDDDQDVGTVSAQSLADPRIRRSEYPADMALGAITQTSVGQTDGPIFGSLNNDLGATWLNVEVTSTTGEASSVYLQYAVFDSAQLAERAFQGSDVQDVVARLGDQTDIIEAGSGLPNDAILWVQSRMQPPIEEPAPRLGSVWVTAGTVTVVGNVLVVTYFSVSERTFDANEPALDPDLAIGPAYDLTVAAVAHVERIA